MEFNEAKLMPLVDVRYVLGLKPTFKKVTLERYEKLLKSTRKVIKGFLMNGATRSKEKKRDPISYMKMKETFSAKLDPERVTKVTFNYGEPIDQAAVFLAEDISNIYATMPTNQVRTLFGIEETEPSAYEMSVWHNRIQVLFYPTDVMRHFMSGALSLAEVEFLKEIYPEYYQDIQRIAFEELVGIENSDPPLSIKDTMTLSALIGVQRLSPNLITEIQKLLTMPEEKPKSELSALTSESMATEVEQGMK